MILTGDHGEEFKEHNQLGHGRTLFAEQLRVPPIIAGHPVFPAGERRQQPDAIVDLTATVLELFGADLPPGSSGVSLASTRGLRKRPRFAESIGFGAELNAAYQGMYKVIEYRYNGLRLYFDLKDDPGERVMSRADPTGGALDAALAAHASVSVQLALLYPSS